MKIFNEEICYHIRCTDRIRLLHCRGAHRTRRRQHGLRADETCSSPYLARIEGQEEFVYVWTLGVEGLGDGSDKLVTD